MLRWNPVLISAAVIGGVNATGYIYTAATHSHKVTDACGTGAFVASAAATCLAFVKNHRDAFPQKPLPLRPLLLGGAVTLWGTRLGLFLFQRIMNSPKDTRLEEFFPKKGELPIRLAGFWSVQALWGFICMLPISAACSVKAQSGARLGSATGAALTLFLAGFLCEAVADHQKSAFKASPSGNKWCDQGLWQYSRHPNYFGELVVWWSIFAAAYPTVPLWTIASPLFSSLLILGVSGVPILEKKYQEKYGADPQYQRYKETTSLLVPLPKFDSATKKEL